MLWPCNYLSVYHYFHITYHTKAVITNPLYSLSSTSTPFHGTPPTSASQIWPYDWVQSFPVFNIPGSEERTLKKHAHTFFFPPADFIWRNNDATALEISATSHVSFQSLRLQKKRVPGPVRTQRCKFMLGLFFFFLSLFLYYYSILIWNFAPNLGIS